eukprot:CAMPEP_0180505172 /NCGR_PEP_ID=MMETSP1036_2-20121128/47208_1 /TAXON_ID=632150 /ORGANISM="Azadinium spinosum, Strain 3D9" /LENGTH=69 /DNA_ID=CAMNT_0022514817 /DNA_START=32 /DNA_END=237 /DNA_ORIENTATION=-
MSSIADDSSSVFEAQASSEPSPVALLAREEVPRLLPLPCALRVASSSTGNRKSPLSSSKGGTSCGALAG